MTSIKVITKLTNTYKGSGNFSTSDKRQILLAGFLGALLLGSLNLCLLKLVDISFGINSVGEEHNSVSVNAYKLTVESVYRTHNVVEKSEEVFSVCNLFNADNDNSSLLEAVNDRGAILAGLGSIDKLLERLVRLCNLLCIDA